MNDPMGGEAPIIQRAPAKKVKKRIVKRGHSRRPRIEPHPEVMHAEAAVQRTPSRQPTRTEGTRDTAREPARSGAVIVMGRNGEVLTRRHTATLDKFDVPLNEIPAGWSYQWNTITVLNKGLDEVVVADREMYNQGWRPVPATRHDGRFAPHGFEGAIILEGMRLEERPASLTKEAKAEDEMKAKSLIRDRTDALRMTQKALPGAGVASSRGNAGGMRMSIDPGLDIPSPQHELEEE